MNIENLGIEDLSTNQLASVINNCLDKCNKQGLGLATMTDEDVLEKATFATAAEAVLITTYYKAIGIHQDLQDLTEMSLMALAERKRDCKSLEQFVRASAPVVALQDKYADIGNLLVTTLLIELAKDLLTEDEFIASLSEVQDVQCAEDCEHCPHSKAYEVDEECDGSCQCGDCAGCCFEDDDEEDEEEVNVQITIVENEDGSIHIDIEDIED